MPRVGPVSSEGREGPDQVLMKSLNGIALGIVRRGFGLHDPEGHAHILEQVASEVRAVVAVELARKPEAAEDVLHQMSHHRRGEHVLSGEGLHPLGEKALQGEDVLVPLGGGRQGPHEVHAPRVKRSGCRLREEHVPLAARLGLGLTRSASSKQVTDTGSHVGKRCRLLETVLGSRRALVAHELVRPENGSVHHVVRDGQLAVRGEPHRPGYDEVRRHRFPRGPVDVAGCLSEDGILALFLSCLIRRRHRCNQCPEVL